MSVYALFVASRTLASDRNDMS